MYAATLLGAIAGAALARANSRVGRVRALRAGLTVFGLGMIGTFLLLTLVRPELESVHPVFGTVHDALVTAVPLTNLMVAIPWGIATGAAVFMASLFHPVVAKKRRPNARVER